MSKKLVITLEDDGKAYRGNKQIATVKDGVIKFKHYSYKKHQQEIEMLMAQDEPVDIGLEPISIPVPEVEDKVMSDINGQPVTPKHLFETESGIYYGELTPEVVEWRKAHWSKEEFNAKYNKHEALLDTVFSKHNKVYVRNNNISG